MITGLPDLSRMKTRPLYKATLLRNSISSRIEPTAKYKGTIGVKNAILPTACLFLSVCSVTAQSPSPTKASGQTGVTSNLREPVDQKTALHDYLAKSDSSYKIVSADSISTPIGKAKRYLLTSQTWQNLTWTHELILVEPAKVEITDHVLLFITGGSNANTSKPMNIKDLALPASIAQSIGGRVAFLKQVPNQPLLGNRKEDDLITETFLRYLSDKDASWPLLFPMVKSAHRAMDAVQQIARDEWKCEVKSFVVTGASKRGWTTWLTGATDRRVVGIAPMVIDTLNFKRQMEHQKNSWGYYSEQIADYTSKGLVDLIVKDTKEPLFKWVDPFTYRRDVSMPKLVINGANDRYWSTDATSIYWDDLPGSKRLLYCPNAGHDLKSGVTTVASSMGVFFRCIANQRPLPGVEWSFRETNGRWQLYATTKDKVKRASLWSAKHTSKDFREVAWQRSDCARAGDAWVADLQKPEQGHVANFASFDLEVEGRQFTTSTLIKIQ